MDENQDDSVEQARVAYEADPDNPDTFTQLIEELGYVERYEEALAIVEAKLQAKPEHGRALYFRAMLLDDLGRYSESAQAFEISAQHSPGFGIVYACWSGVLIKMGRYEEAQSVLERGLEAEPNHPGILANLAAMAGRRKQYDEVIRLARRTIEVDPESPSGWDNLGIALHQTGDLFGAKNAFEQSARFDPDSAETYYNYARLLFELGELDDALKMFTRAAAFDTADPDAVAYIARIHLRQDNYEAAEADLQEVLKRDPRSSFAHFQLARLAHMRNDPDSIEYHARQGIAIREDSADHWEWLGIGLGLKNQLPEALEAFQQAVRLQPERARIRLNLAQALADLGRGLEACAELERILSSDADQNTKRMAKEMLESLTHPKET